MIPRILPELARLVGARILAIGDVPVEEAWDRILEKMSTENEWMSTYMAQVHLQFPAFLHALGLGETDTSGPWTLLLADGRTESIDLEAHETTG